MVTKYIMGQPLGGGGGKYSVKVNLSTPGVAWLQVATADGTGCAELGFDSVTSLLEFQSAIAVAAMGAVKTKVKEE